MSLPLGFQVFVSATETFSSAHRLHSIHLSKEENEATYGKCNNPNGHGHNYRLEVVVTGNVDPKTGMIINLTQLKSIMKSAVIDELDHRHVDLDVPYFLDNGVPSTAENIAIFAFNRMKHKLPSNVELDSIKLYETEKNVVEIRGKK